MSEAPLVEIESLSVDFATANGAFHALRDVSLSIGKRRVVGIVGESGSGKSTLALALLGLLPRQHVERLRPHRARRREPAGARAGRSCGACAAPASP